MKEEYLRVLYELSQKDGQPTFSYSEQQVACGHNDAARLSTYLGLKIVLVRDGVGQWMIGETDYTVRAGDILILDPSGERYLYYVTPPVPFRMDFITFSPAAAYPNIGCLDVFLHRPREVGCVLSAGDDCYEKVREQFETITEEIRNTGDILKEEAIHAELLSLLVGISRAYRRKYRKTESVNDILSQRQSFERVSRVVEYLNLHYSEPVTEEAAASAVGMSSGHLSRLLQKYWGIGFSEYLRRVRVRHVIMLLYAEPDRSVLDIAYSCGFGSASGFYKTMKELTHLTPRELVRRSPIPHESV